MSYRPLDPKRRELLKAGSVPVVLARRPTVMAETFPREEIASTVLLTQGIYTCDSPGHLIGAQGLSHSAHLLHGRKRSSATNMRFACSSVTP